MLRKSGHVCFDNDLKNLPAFETAKVAKLVELEIELLNTQDMCVIYIYDLVTTE